jgi:hypothetical protein
VGQICQKKACKNRRKYGKGTRSSIRITVERRSFGCATQVVSCPVTGVRCWERRSNGPCRVPAATGLPYHGSPRLTFRRFCRLVSLSLWRACIDRSIGQAPVCGARASIVSKRYKPSTLDKGNETNSDLPLFGKCSPGSESMGGTHLKGGWTRRVAMNARRRGKD